MRLLRSIVVGVMFILTSFLLCPLSAQTTGAEGVVKDATTGETLPSVQVYFAGTTIGTITDVDEQTENAIFIVSRDDVSELMVPASDDLIVEFDLDKKLMVMDLPQGLLDLNE